MEAVKELQRQYVDFLTSVYNEGRLNDQFLLLQTIEDENNPALVNTIIPIFLRDAEKILSELTIPLEKDSVDFQKVHSCVCQLKGSSSSIGARKVYNVCVAVMTNCCAKNIEGCKENLRQARDELSLVKSNLCTLIRLKQDIIAAGGALPEMK